MSFKNLFERDLGSNVEGRQTNKTDFVSSKSACHLEKSRNFGMDITRGRISNPLRYKTELCRSFEEEGVCGFGAKCTFAHSLMELRAVPRHPRYKSELCKTYHTIGYCQYGIRCHFIHDEDDSGCNPYSLQRIGKARIAINPNVARSTFETSSHDNRSEKSMYVANLNKLLAVQSVAGSSICQKVDSTGWGNLSPNSPTFSPVAFNSSKLSPLSACDARSHTSPAFGLVESPLYSLPTGFLSSRTVDSPKPSDCSISPNAAAHSPNISVGYVASEEKENVFYNNGIFGVFREGVSVSTPMTPGTMKLSNTSNFTGNSLESNDSIKIGLDINCNITNVMNNISTPLDYRRWEAPIRDTRRLKTSVQAASNFAQHDRSYIQNNWRPQEMFGSTLKVFPVAYRNQGARF